MTNTSTVSGRRHTWTRGERLRAAREHMPGHPSQAAFAHDPNVKRARTPRR